MIKPKGMGWKGHVAHMRKINTHKILVGKPEGNIPLGRPRCRCEDNIKLDVTDTRWESVD
jgi:hypothetical protein